MDRIIELTKELKRELDQLPLFQEYKMLKKEVENNQDLKQLKRQILLAKKESRNEDHKYYLNLYNNHPIVINYLDAEEEVKQYLKEITRILNEK